MCQVLEMPQFTSRDTDQNYSGHRLAGAVFTAVNVESGLVAV